MVRGVLTLAFALIAAAAFLWIMSEEAEAQTAVVAVPSSRVIHEGENAEIHVVPDPGQILTGQQVEVITPYACSYVSTYGTAAADGNYTFFFPDQFSPGPANPPDCPSEPNTDVSMAHNGASFYKVRALQGVDTAPNCAAWRVHCFQARFTATGSRDFLRTDRIQFVSTGYAPGTPVTLQLDAPPLRDGPQYLVVPLTANQNGTIQYTHALAPGWHDPAAREADVGQWTARLIGGGKGGQANEDSMTFRVNRTTLALSWTDQPDANVVRTNLTNSYFSLVYVTSIPGSQPRVVTTVDFAGVGTGPELDILQGTVQNGTSTTQFSVATGQWRVNFEPEPNRPLGPYRFGPVFTFDAYNNTMPGWPSNPSQLLSESFNLLTAQIRPNFIINSFSVKRADFSQGLDGELVLRYPSGKQVQPSDLAGDLELAVFQNGVQIPGATFTPTPSGSRWIIGGAAATTLPPNTPLGTVQLRVVAPPTDNVANQGNPIDQSVGSVSFNVLPTQPRITAGFLNRTAETKAFLRGEQFQAAVGISYPDTTSLTQDHVGVAGEPTQGSAILRLMPPDHTTRNLRLDYNAKPERHAGQWYVDYTIHPTDPVGVWKVNVSIADRWGNRNETEYSIRVGLVVQTILSSSEVERAENLTVQASVTRPGTNSPETGQLNVTIRAGGQAIVTAAPMEQTAQGTYRYVHRVPSTAALGTYTVEVRARSTVDHGLDIVTFNVVTTGIRVSQVTVSPTTVTRLASVDLGFILRYPDNAPLSRQDATPQVRAESGSLKIPVTPQFDATTGRWSARFETGLSTPTGEYCFVISGRDRYNNAVEAFTTRCFVVNPAELRVTNLRVAQVGYRRGETVDIRAEVHYADGTPAPSVIVPVDIMGGSTPVASVDLRFDPAVNLHRGSYAINLSDPLSSAAASWGLLVRQDSIQDTDGNAGPPVDTRDTGGFETSAALLSVRILEEPTTALQIGRDYATIRFQLISTDGTPVRGGLEGLQVALKRGTTVFPNASLEYEGDTIVARFALSEKEIAPGTDYSFIIQGTDTFGNTVHQTGSSDFQLSRNGGDSPAPGVLAALVAAATVGVAVGRRRR